MRDRHLAVKQMQVGPAHPARADRHKQLIARGQWGRNLDLLDSPGGDDLDRAHAGQP
jgi:hypothetical protein